MQQVLDLALLVAKALAPPLSCIVSGLQAVSVPLLVLLGSYIGLQQFERNPMF